MADVQRWLTTHAADGRRPDPRAGEPLRAGQGGGAVPLHRARGSDDPNDIYPHERRRELRGMRVFAAWLNHDDARSINSIDTYVQEDGRRYIRHYLQDFGSNLGSGSTSAQQPRGGNEYLIEGDKIAKGLVTFGFCRRDWAKVRYPDNPSLGNIEAEFFQPWKWKTEYPQPAFDQMDDADAFWAASLVVALHQPDDRGDRRRPASCRIPPRRAISPTSSSSGATRWCRTGSRGPTRSTASRWSRRSAARC